MLYHFELQMVGVILFSAMAAGGVSLWLKKRRMQKELEENVEEYGDNSHNP